MNSLSIALIAVGCLGSGIVAGSLIRSHLPDLHLHDDSRDALKLASGMMGTLVALVIGLLVGSSKSSYDQASAGVTQIGAKVILLDRVLRRYGPETKEIRAQMSRGLASNVERIWPRAPHANPNLAAVEQATGMEDAEEMIVRLEPRDEVHRFLRTHALSLINELVQSRWLMIEQAQSRLPPTFLAMLILWLTVLFASLGLLSPRNPTTLCCLVVCSLSMASAIYLIIEMNRPLEGMIQVSPGPLLKAISVIRE